MNNDQTTNSVIKHVIAYAFELVAEHKLGRDAAPSSHAFSAWLAELLIEHVTNKPDGTCNCGACAMAKGIKKAMGAALS
jgi:hypothetical protein